MNKKFIFELENKNIEFMDTKYLLKYPERILLNKFIKH